MFPGPMIKACNKNFVLVVIMRTPYSRIQARIQFQDDYPDSPILLELDSPTLPQPFLRKLTKQAEEQAHKLRGQPQAVAALQVVVDTVNKNKFLPCWKELRQVAQMVVSKGAEIRADESTGLITVKVKSGQYFIRVAIQIPDGYPMDGCTIELRSHNFPQGVARGHLTQAAEIVRRCLCGYSPEMALQTSNPISLPANRAGKGGGEPRVRITSEHMRDIKHDMEYIKRAHDLRDFDKEKNKDNHSQHAHSTKERKAARRELKTLTKAEIVKEEEQIRRMEELELKEQEDLLRSQISDTSQPSLYPLVDFVVNVFANRLPMEKCLSCHQRVLPDDPSHPALSSTQHMDRPTRVFCGHWFHYDCLRKWMTEPPFAKDCPMCHRRVYHPDWPQTVQQLEKSWANKQAKTREIGEVRDFLDVAEKFQQPSRGDDFGAFL
ncbi:unnamed protein product [Discosporangium mesarthrocarpum]